MRLFIALLFLLPTFASAELSPAEKAADLQFLHDQIAAEYGPLHYKEVYLGLNLESLTSRYREEAAGTTDEEFRYLILRYIAEFHDSHFGGRVNSKAVSTLGFSTDLVEGKALISTIDRSVLPDFPYTRGDEIVTFNGAPVAKEVADLASHIGMGNVDTQQKLGAYFLSVREARVLPLPTGNARLGIRRHGESEMHTVELPWRPTKTSGKGSTGANVAVEDWCSEKSRITPPAGAEIITDVPFTAYTFPTPRGKIGFLHIPHYFPVDKNGQEVAGERFAQYERVVGKFEAETVGLIIDQHHNCGGSILYLHKLVSLFARAPFRPIEIEFRAAKGNLEGLSHQLARFTPATPGYDALENIVTAIRNGIVAGAYATPRLPAPGFLEMTLPLEARPEIQPNPVRYTKPIVLLIDEMSGSGGDVFPAILQDLGRARLFGKHTMGAGGHLWDDPHVELPHSGVSVNLTRSLIYRLNGEPVENRPVEPEVPHEITTQDFLDGFQEYFSAATAELLRML